MTTIQYEVPTVRKVQVLVVGGGCAGIAAAVSAARHGVKTLLVDMNGMLGGLATAGLVGPFMTCSDPDGKRQVIKGVMEELIQRMIKKGGALHPMNVDCGNSYTAYRIRGHKNCTPFDAECYKQAAEEMCVESGVELLYHAVYVSSCMNENGTKIEGAVFAAKNGLMRIDADMVIDCTGDGDVAYRSGVPCQYGDDEGKTQPASMFFVIRNVDREKMEKAIAAREDKYFEKDIAEDTAAGLYTVPRTKVALYQCADGTWRVNMSRVTVTDGCDAFAVTKATLQGRKQVDEILSLLRRRVPGCENCELVETASVLGQRETRRIQGDFVLKGADISGHRDFEDVIFLAGSSIDMHVGNSVHYEEAKGGAYAVPYRILLPKKVENMLVAGRCASLDRLALAAIRVMPPVFAMGQAAGTAAALALNEKCAPKDVNIKELQKLLRQDNAVLE